MLLRPLQRLFSTHISKMGPLKTPKGMRDIWPACQREEIMKTIAWIFRSHGARSLDTPVCELSETLTNKYGEDSKLIYDLKDQGGEQLSLRYDLTVPFARFLAQNKIQAISRYHIGKVYRRDNPSITKGRFREFFQCDIDFAGKFDTMMADAKCLKILCEILEQVNLPHKFCIKINHRQVLSGMFQICGVPAEKFKPICSSIDKLDKMPWDEVKQEMCKIKGLDETVADRIHYYVGKAGDLDLIDELLEGDLGKNADAKKGLEELKTLYKHTNLMNVSDKVKFDMSLARGLDYYTGLIFEAVVEGDVDVGSIAAGGRYDNLVSDLMENARFNVPIVGLSVGIERLFAILESSKGGSSFDCCVGSIGDDEVLAYRYQIIDMLRKQGFLVRDILKVNVKPLMLYQTCEDEGVPFSIFFGKGEMGERQVSLRKLADRKDEKIPVDELATTLRRRLDEMKSGGDDES